MRCVNWKVKLAVHTENSHKTLKRLEASGEGNSVTTVLMYKIDARCVVFTQVVVQKRREKNESLTELGLHLDGQ